MPAAVTLGRPLCATHPPSLHQLTSFPMHAHDFLPSRKYDELLAGMGGNIPSAFAPEAERATAEYAPNDGRFELHGAREFERQFAQLYFYRLTTMRPDVEATARARWPGVRGVQRMGGRAAPLRRDCCCHLLCQRVQLHS